MDVLVRPELPLKPVSTGKVRDIYELGENLIMVATDRLSAFDVVFKEGIPLKGAVLTQLSAFWFRKTERIAKNHLITEDVEKFGGEVANFKETLRLRSMLVRRAKPLKAECIVRGYITGGGWKSYQKSGTVCGHKLPSGLKECAQLPEPIFTPTTKADKGHDLDITREKLAEIVGKDEANFLEEASLKLYESAADYARGRGIIIADTKVEFGKFGDETILIDELLTPDSSRFWSLEGYAPGTAQPSFDKQFVRDYLEKTGWNKEPPPPALPKGIIEMTSKKYVEAYEKLTGESFPKV